MLFNHLARMHPGLCKKSDLYHWLGKPKVLTILLEIVTTQSML